MALSAAPIRRMNPFDGFSAWGDVIRKGDHCTVDSYGYGNTLYVHGSSQLAHMVGMHVWHVATSQRRRTAVLTFGLPGPPYHQSLSLIHI